VKYFLSAKHISSEISNSCYLQSSAQATTQALSSAAIWRNIVICFVNSR